MATIGQAATVPSGRVTNSDVRYGVTRPVTAIRSVCAGKPMAGAYCTRRGYCALRITFTGAGVQVAVGVEVRVGVWLGVLVGVRVAVEVDVAVAVGVRVAVAVAVADDVEVGV